MSRFANYLEKPKWREYLRPERYSEQLLSVYRIVAAALREECLRITITADMVQLGTEQDSRAGRRFTVGVDLRENFECVVTRDPMMRRHVKCAEKAAQRVVYDVTD